LRRFLRAFWDSIHGRRFLEEVGMKTRGQLLAVFLLGVVAACPALAEYNSFIEAAQTQATPVPGPGPTEGFGDLLGSWPSGIGSVVTICYDPELDGIWFASEGSGGVLYCKAAQGTHQILRQINVLGFGITGDGNQDGVALDLANRVIYVCDYQGDLVLSDDVIYGINYDTGSLVGVWHIDGAQNPNPSAHINTIIDICLDSQGHMWACDWEGLLHEIILQPDGMWSQVQQFSVPGGGSLGGLDWDECLDEFFVGNFSYGTYGYCPVLTSPPTQQFSAPTGQATGITSDEIDTVFTCTWTDSYVYVHEGIVCHPTPVEETTWGALKGMFR
jgi:hypothetical protein